MNIFPGPRRAATLMRKLFRNERIELAVMTTPDTRNMKQLYPPFESGVSIIDLIFNEGPDAGSIFQVFQNESSIVSTLYYSRRIWMSSTAGYVRAEKITREFEIILVNDGSPDKLTGNRSLDPPEGPPGSR